MRNIYVIIKSIKIRKVIDMILSDKLEDCVMESLVDGEGYRLVMFLQWCVHKCPGCHNQRTWDKDKGINYTVDEVYNYLDSKLQENPYLDGVTFSGGDPLLQDKELQELIVKIKAKYDDINIWAYTGFIYEDIKNKEVLKHIDVLVDGRFEQDKRYPQKAFRGSYNQRLLRLEDGKVMSVE